MGLLAGGPWGSQAQAPERGLGGGGRSIAGGARMWSLRACTVRARGRAGGRARSAALGELESEEPGSGWRCRARGKARERERFRGWAGGTRERAGDENAPLATPTSSAGGEVARSTWNVGSQGSWCSGGLWGFPDIPLPRPEAARPCLQPSHSTLSTHRPLEFSRWKFTSEALWPRIRQPVSSLLPPPPTPSHPVGSRTGAPQDHRALLPGGQLPRKETGPLVTPACLSPFPTSSRHICDLSLCVLFIVWRPGLPANSELDRPSRGPRQPSQPSPEQPPARALSAAPEPSRPRAGRACRSLWSPGACLPHCLPMFTASLCLPHFTLGDAPVWTGPACHPAETLLVARALAPGLLVCHFTGFHPPATALLGGLVTRRRPSQGPLGEQGGRRACMGCMCTPLHVHVGVCVGGLGKVCTHAHPT